jgi:hypothetical protein
VSPLADPQPLVWRDYAAAAVLALAIAVGGALRMVPGVVGVIDDDAIYTVTAKALAEGDGYYLINLPGEPAQTKYPVLFPALLSLAWHAGDSLESRIFAAQCATTALAALALALAWLYCVRFRVGSRSSAFAGCLLAASAQNVLFYSSQTLSEMPFLVLLVAALWAGETRLRAVASSPAREFLAGVVLALPLLVRTAGAVVPMAAALVLLRHGRPLRWVVPGMVAVGLPWALWVLHGSDAAADAVIAYQTDYWGWWLDHGSLQTVAANAYKAGEAFVHIDLEGFAHALYTYGGGATWLFFAIGILPWIAVVAEARSFGLLPVTLLAYVALLCAWPWPPDRFLVPVLPFLGALLFEATRRALRKTGAGRGGEIALGGLLVAALLSNGWVLSRYVSASRQSGYPYFMLTDAPVDWRQYQIAFEWLRGHSRPDDVIAAGFDAMTALYTDRHTVRPFELNSQAMFYGGTGSPISGVGEFEKILARHGARFLLLAPLPAYVVEEAFYELVNAAIDGRPGLLRPVWQSKEDSRFAIFEISARPAGF